MSIRINLGGSQQGVVWVVEQDLFARNPQVARGFSVVARKVDGVEAPVSLAATIAEAAQCAQAVASQVSASAVRLELRIWEGCALRGRWVAVRCEEPKAAPRRRRAG